MSLGIAGMKQYQRNPAKILAGRVDKVFFDEDNEDAPFIVWIGSSTFGLSDEVCGKDDPEVGNYLVIPIEDGEPQPSDAVILTNRMFHTLYAERFSKSVEAASSISPDLH